MREGLAGGNPWGRGWGVGGATSPSGCTEGSLKSNFVLGSLVPETWAEIRGDQEEGIQAGRENILCAPGLGFCPQGPQAFNTGCLGSLSSPARSLREQPHLTPLPGSRR